MPSIEEAVANFNVERVALSAKILVAKACDLEDCWLALALIRAEADKMERMIAGVGDIDWKAIVEEKVANVI